MNTPKPYETRDANLMHDVLIRRNGDSDFASRSVPFSQGLTAIGRMFTECLVVLLLAFGLPASGATPEQEDATGHANTGSERADDPEDVDW